MPTIQGSDDFNHAITVPTFYDSVFGSPTSVGTPLYQSQPASLKVPSAGGNVGVRKNLTGTPSRPWLGFAFRAESYPSGTTSIYICALHPVTAPNNEMRLELSGDGVGGALFKSAFTGGSVVDGAVYTAGTWVWIEAMADFTATTYNGYWQVGGVEQIPPTKDDEVVDTADYTQIISYVGDTTLDWYAAFWHWGVAASYSDWMGEPGVETQSFYVTRRRTVGAR